jgi:hypothetical protein
MYSDGTYLERNPTWHVEDSPWKAARILTLLRRNRVEPKTICEIGCGAGEILRQLQTRLGGDCVLCGYEISPQALALAQQRANAKLHFKLGDVATDQGTFFDVMLIIDVIEHLENYFGLLQQVKPKSRYKVLHIPLDLSVQSVLRRGRLLDLRHSVGHIHYFTKDIALQAVVDAGYKIVDYMYTGSGVEQKGKSIKNGLARLPRRALFAMAPDFAVRLLGGYSLMVLAE